MIAHKEYEVNIDPDEESQGGWILKIQELQKKDPNSLPFKETLEKRKYPSAKDLISHIGVQRVWRDVQLNIGVLGGTAGIMGSLIYGVSGETPYDPAIRLIIWGLFGTFTAVSGGYMTVRAASENIKLRKIDEKIKETYFRTISEGFKSPPANQPQS